MSALDDPTDVYEPDADDLLRRPLPPRTWRDRLDDLAAGGGSPGRVVAAVVAVVVAGAVGWRLLAPPAPPPEVEIPFAEPVTGGETGAPAAGGGAGEAPVGDAAASGPGAAGTGPGGGAGVGAPGADGVAGPDGAVGPEGTAGAAGEVVVHVVGAVAAPGVQRLPAGALVIDAVDAAGGATGDADLARINLAAAVVDGQQVYVLRVGEVPPMLPAAPAGGAATPAGDDDAGGLVDINRASATELEELPGVGPTTAEAIIAHREQNGPFASVDDLIDVRGIGEAKLEQIRAQATV